MTDLLYHLYGRESGEKNNIFVIAIVDRLTRCYLGFQVVRQRTPAIANFLSQTDVNFLLPHAIILLLRKQPAPLPFSRAQDVRAI